MKKIIKFILIIPVILFVIYIGFLSYIKSSININSIKDNINKSLSDKIQEYKQHQLFLKKDIKFAIRGKINLSIFPTIKIIGLRISTAIFLLRRKIGQRDPVKSFKDVQEVSLQIVPILLASILPV